MRTQWATRTNGIFWTIVASAALIKIILAYCTFGTNDVLFFQGYAQKIEADGVIALYRDGIALLDAAGRPRHLEGFFHPPFITNLLVLLTWLRNLTGLAFPFLFRLLSIFADIGSAVLVKSLLEASADRADAQLKACLFAGSPLLIFLSGFHGNTDPVMIFFLILSVWLLVRGSSPWMAGLAFGMSCNIKIWPLILVPVFVLYVPRFRGRLWFSLAAGSVFLLGGMPVIARDPVLVASRVFGYASYFGRWGVSRILALTGPDEVLSLYGNHARTILMVTAVGLAVLMHWKSNSGLVVRVGVVVSLFLALTPGFGIQYLSWLLPWLISLEVEAMLIYLVCTSVFMFHVYTFWSKGFPWYLADSTLVGNWRGFLLWHELLCWLSVLLCLLLFLRKAGLLGALDPGPLRSSAGDGQADTRSMAKGGSRRRSAQVGEGGGT